MLSLFAVVDFFYIYRVVDVVSMYKARRLHKGMSKIMSRHSPDVLVSESPKRVP